MYVEPTIGCNLTCRICMRNVWEDSVAHMGLEVFQLMEQAAALPELRQIVFWAGEPSTHPRFLDMVRLARQHGLAVTVGTNGLLLDRAISRALVELGVDRLVVSLDSVKPETYANVRGVALAQVLENIRGLNDAKKEAVYHPATPSPTLTVTWP